MDFDTEQFIIEVQNRPVIWNKQSEEHSDKQLRKDAWDELVEVYGGDLPEDEKLQLRQDLQKKWRNIRDAFVKTHKAKQSRTKYVRKKGPYVFYENLLFLKDSYSEPTVRADDGAARNRDEDDLPLKRRKKQIDKGGPSFCEVSVEAPISEAPIENDRKHLEDDDDRLFFMSLIKDFKRIPDHKQTQAKLDILKVINDAQWSGNLNIKRSPCSRSEYSE